MSSSGCGANTSARTGRRGVWTCGVSIPGTAGVGGVRGRTDIIVGAFGTRDVEVRVAGTFSTIGGAAISGEAWGGPLTTGVVLGNELSPGKSSSSSHPAFDVPSAMNFTDRRLTTLPESGKYTRYDGVSLSYPTNTPSLLRASSLDLGWTSWTKQVEPKGYILLTFGLRPVSAKYAVFFKRCW